MEGQPQLQGAGPGERQVDMLTASPTKTLGCGRDTLVILGELGGVSGSPGLSGGRPVGAEGTSCQFLGAPETLLPVWVCECKYSVCEGRPGDSWQLGVPAPLWGATGSEPQPEGMADASPSENPVFWPLKAKGGDSDSLWQGHQDSSRGVLGGIRE